MKNGTALQITMDPMTDLTLAEKLSCRIAYGPGWEDDLDWVVLAPSDMNLSFMNRDATVTECPMQRPREGGECPGVMTDGANGSCWQCSECDWTDDHGPMRHRPTWRKVSLYLFHHA